MRILICGICIAFYLLFPIGQTALAKESVSGDKAPGAVAFVNVNVVPMDSERILPAQTVIVRADRISEISPVDTTKIPKGALRIDGSGKYLMPGLADMHVHLDYYDMAILFLANGVTTVRNMWGSGWNLNMQDKIQKGEIIGPTIHTTGPIIDGNPPIYPGSEVVETPDQAARIVAENKKEGYEFIKIYENLSLECFDAVIKAAAKHDIPVVGHVPAAVDLEHALASDMYTIEHLTAYGRLLQIQDCPEWVKLNEGKISHIAEATSKAGVWNCPTLVVMEEKDVEKQLKKPYMQYAPEPLKRIWHIQNYEDPNNVRKVSNMKRMVKALHDTGAKILLGTDTPNPHVMPGFSIHQELQNLVDAGLTPYEAIRAGTRDAAECMGKLDEFGAVRAGLRADLILVKGNPLEDLSHIENNLGVMVRGQWLPKKELQRMLDNVEASYKRPTENRFVDVPNPQIEGEKVFSGRYEFTYGAFATGEERIIVAKMPDGKNIVYAQVAVDPPHDVFAAMELIFDEAGKCYSLVYDFQTSAWKDSLRMDRKKTALNVSGQLAYGKEINIRETIDEETLLATDIVGSVMPLVQVAKPLKVGQTREVKSKMLQGWPDYSVFEETMTVEKAADSTRQTPAGIIPIQTFNIDAKRKTNLYKAVITLDKAGRLLEYERESQMGPVKFVRTE